MSGLLPAPKGRVPEMEGRPGPGSEGRARPVVMGEDEGEERRLLGWGECQSFKMGWGG